MKTVIIGGVCRTGKSYLANKIFTNTRATVFHADTLTNSLKNNFPQIFAVNGDRDPSEIILKKIIRHMGKEFDYLRIFESSVISVITIHQHFRDRQYISLFLGYPHVNATQKLSEIRQAAIANPNCWSHQYCDRQMLDYIEHFKSLSLQLQQDCQKLALPFIDTSDWSKGMQTAYDFIINRLI